MANALGAPQQRSPQGGNSFPVYEGPETFQYPVKGGKRSGPVAP